MVSVVVCCNLMSVGARCCLLLAVQFEAVSGGVCCCALCAGVRCSLCAACCLLFVHYCVFVVCCLLAVCLLFV